MRLAYDCHFFQRPVYLDFIHKAFSIFNGCHHFYPNSLSPPPRLPLERSRERALTAAFDDADHYDSGHLVNKLQHT